MLALSPDVAWHTVNTTGLFKRGKYRYSIGKWFRRNKKNENHDGLSDITGMMITGQFFAIEVKKAGKIPTAEQQDFLDYVKNNSGLSGVATNAKEAETIIRGYQIQL